MIEEQQTLAVAVVLFCIGLAFLWFFFSFFWFFIELAWTIVLGFLEGFFSVVGNPFSFLRSIGILGALILLPLQIVGFVLTLPLKILGLIFPFISTSGLSTILVFGAIIATFLITGATLLPSLGVDLTGLGQDIVETIENVFSELNPKTYAVTGSGARGRTCPETDNSKCSIKVTFAIGEEIKVVGSVTGDRVSNSTAWLKIRDERFDDDLYIHSSLAVPIESSSPPTEDTPPTEDQSLLKDDLDRIVKETTKTLENQSTWGMKGLTHSFTANWIEENKDLIEKIAKDYGIGPEVLAGVLVSEMVWDYSSWDWHSDMFAKIVFPIPLIQGYGYGSTHRATLVMAINYLNRKYPQQKHLWEIAYTDKATLLSDEGTIKAAAIVTRYLVEQYLEDRNYSFQMTPDDHALIWAAYRAGICSFIFVEDGGAYDTAKKKCEASEVGLPPVFWSNSYSGGAADRTGVIDARMQPLAVVEHLDVVKQSPAGLLS